MAGSLLPGHGPVITDPAANVGNGMVVGANSPVIIQSDNTFTQNASNSNTAANVDAFLLLGRLGGLVRA